jgi:hypothetical protein
VDSVIMNADDHSVIQKVRAQVNDFMNQFALYNELSMVNGEW